MVLSSGADLDLRIETISGAFGRNMTRSSDVIWVISRGTIAPELESGEFVTLPIDCSGSSGPVGLMMRADEEPSPIARLFCHAVQKAVEQLGLADFRDDGRVRKS